MSNERTFGFSSLTTWLQSLSFMIKETNLNSLILIYDTIEILICNYTSSFAAHSIRNLALLPDISWHLPLIAGNPIHNRCQTKGLLGSVHSPRGYNHSHL